MICSNFVKCVDPNVPQIQGEGLPDFQQEAFARADEISAG